MSLIELIKGPNSNLYKTDKYNPHTYIQDFYDKEFSNYLNKDNFSILEIGVLGGGSLNLWRDYFKGEIIGIDVFARVSLEEVKKYIYEDIKIHTVDSYNKEDKFGFNAVQSRKDFFNLYNKTKFDIIIDDGHHGGDSQVKTFNNFKHLVKEEGIYIIEDIKGDFPHYQTIKEANIPNLELLDLTEGSLSDNRLGIIRF